MNPVRTNAERTREWIRKCVSTDNHEAAHMKGTERDWDGGCWRCQAERLTEEENERSRAR